MKTDLEINADRALLLTEARIRELTVSGDAKFGTFHELGEDYC